MATTSKTIPSDEEWDDMLEKALECQQTFYEILPDWTVYKKDQIKYIKQNIGYALYGAPFFEKTETSKDILNYETRNLTDNTEISDLVNYGSSASKVIQSILDKILKYGDVPESDTIKCGIIYQIIFRNRRFTESKSTKNEGISAVPIFKVQQYDCKTKITTNWYIDIKARVYTSWENYIMSNNLPKCTIVFPKDGYYQPDPTKKMYPDHYFVWVVAQDSYACSERANVVSGINVAVNTISTGTAVGLGIATLVTPVGPVCVAAGLVTSCVSGLWTIGKCSTELYDRSIHEESISPFDKDALSLWLGIAGSTVGIAACGGSVLLKRAAMSGKEVGTFAKTVYNATLIGSISINLVGLGYHGVRMYEKYKNTGHVEIQDIIYLGTHLLFFMNNVVDFKFAGDIIEVTQGRILKEFESTLREDNLRKRYDYINGEAATKYGADKTAQNAAVIRYINKIGVNDIPQMSAFDNCFQNTSNVLMFQKSKLNVNGIPLLDPMLFVADFAKAYFKRATKASTSGTHSHSEDQTVLLMKLLEKLLSDLYTSEDYPSNAPMHTTLDFKSFIDELKNIRNAVDILPFIFNTAIPLIRSFDKFEFLVEGCRFVWDYVKKNMCEAGFSMCSNFEDNYSYNTSVKHMIHIFGAVYEALDSMMHRFFNALRQYVHVVNKQFMSGI